MLERRAAELRAQGGLSAKAARDAQMEAQLLAADVRRIEAAAALAVGDTRRAQHEAVAARAEQHNAALAEMRRCSDDAVHLARARAQSPPSAYGSHGAAQAGRPPSAVGLMPPSLQGEGAPGGLLAASAAGHGASALQWTSEGQRREDLELLMRAEPTVPRDSSRGASTGEAQRPGHSPRLAMQAVSGRADNAFRDAMRRLALA